MSVMQHEPTDLAPLSEAEAADLAHCEEVIERGMQTFYETGAALATIRDTKLYRTNHATFESYCHERWGLSRKRGYDLIAAAGVVSNVSPIGDILPANEAQARPLAALPAEDQPRVWHEAVETAPNGKLTAAHVAATVERFTRPASPVSLVPDAIIDPPAPTPQFLTDILRSPEVRAATLREEFSRVMYKLYSVCVVAQQAKLIGNVTPEEMAALLDDSDLKDEGRIQPTLDWVRAVFAARRNAPAIRRIK